MFLGLDLPHSGFFQCGTSCVLEGKRQGYLDTQPRLSHHFLLTSSHCPGLAQEGPERTTLHPDFLVGSRSALQITPSPPGDGSHVTGGRAG